MIFEYCVVELTQGAAAQRAEIGDVILVEMGVCLPLVLAAAGHQADLAHELLFRDAVPESRVAGAEYGSQHTVAWRRTFLQVRLLPHTFAGCAERLGQPYRL